MVFTDPWTSKDRKGKGVILLGDMSLLGKEIFHSSPQWTLICLIGQDFDA